MAQNPDLQDANSDTPVQPHVSPLAAITPPMPNTKVREAVYFTCTIMNASMFRPDGKKLPFVAGFLKTNIQEDIAYLDGEIENGNQYIHRANSKEVEQARMYEDPLGAIKDVVRLEMEKQVRDNYTIPQLEALLAEKKNPKPKDVSPVEAPEQKARRLLAELGSKKLKPAGTDAVTSGIASSNSGDVAR